MEVMKLYDMTKRFREMRNETSCKGYYFQQDAWCFRVYRISIPEGADRQNAFSVETDIIDKREVADYMDLEEMVTPIHPFRHYEPADVADTLIQLDDFSNPEYLLFNNYMDAINHISKDGVYQIVRLE